MFLAAERYAVASASSKVMLYNFMEKPRSTVKPVLVVSSINLATCIKQACIHCQKNAKRWSIPALGLSAKSYTMYSVYNILMYLVE